MTTVYVTNQGDFDHSDSYVGVPYHFPRGISVELPLEAAENLLGYGFPDKTEFVIRLGWSKTSQDMPEALEKLDKFKFSDEPFQNRSLPSAVGTVPLQIARSAGRKAIARAA